MTAAPIENLDRHLLDLLPCPSWCHGHPNDAGVYDSDWQPSVHHVSRTGSRLMASNPDLWTHNQDGPVFVLRIDTYHEGTVDIGAPTICINVNDLDCEQDVVDMTGDLLAAGLVLREALQ